jgi:hypothetical protein
MNSVSHLVGRKAEGSFRAARIQGKAINAAGLVRVPHEHNVRATHAIANRMLLFGWFHSALCGMSPAGLALTTSKDFTDAAN